MTLDPIPDAELRSLSMPARVAEPGEQISVEELRLAARNHGLPLEALRYDVTPPGLHYLLTHYDVPKIDTEEYRLTVDGSVVQSLSLDLDALRARPQVSMAVTLECAGNGRALLTPRPGQPTLAERGRWHLGLDGNATGAAAPRSGTRTRCS